MKYMPLLTDDEVRYLCSVIPLEDIVSYFKKNPKQFSKICPGFRPSAISTLNVSELLFRNRNRNFIVFFIEKHISVWLDQIHEHIEKCVANGNGQVEALINTLPLSYFADNTSLYLKLIDKNYPDDYVTLLSLTVKEIKNLTEKQKELEEKVTKKDDENNILRGIIDSKNLQLMSKKDEIANKVTEIDGLRQELSAIEEHRVNNRELNTAIKLIEEEKRILIEKIETLSFENDEILNSKNELQEQFKEMQKKLRCHYEKRFNKPSLRCPCDIEEFKEYLGYNFSSIGVQSSDEAFAALVKYLTKILFRGVPLVVNRVVGENLLKCVSNTLIGNSEVETIIYRKGVSVEEVDEFLLTSDRIVCLDNFIGNFNEIELIPLFETYRDKIFFLTVAYDRTLTYVSKEFLSYCYYFNANRIYSLSSDSELSEDPSVIKENIYTLQHAQGKNRYRTTFHSILNELDYPQRLIEHNVAIIDKEEDLIQSLVFSILPYYVDVLELNPFNKSEKLCRYSDNATAFPQRGLIKRWFS